MVLDKDLRPLHPLTPQGEDAYSQYLEQKADEILFRHQHLINWLLSKARELLSCFFS